jgi:hypothetical protein
MYNWIVSNGASGQHLTLSKVLMTMKQEPFYLNAGGTNIAGTATSSGKMHRLYHCVSYVIAALS